jgi:hypothetical protein
MKNIATFSNSEILKTCRSFSSSALVAAVLFIGITSGERVALCDTPPINDPKKRFSNCSELAARLTSHFAMAEKEELIRLIHPDVLKGIDRKEFIDALGPPSWCSMKGASGFTVRNGVPQRYRTNGPELYEIPFAILETRKTEYPVADATRVTAKSREEAIALSQRSREKAIDEARKSNNLGFLAGTVTVALGWKKEDKPYVVAVTGLPFGNLLQKSLYDSALSGGWLNNP